MSKSQSQETTATPLFRQYFALKKEYPDAILLFRLGDFYEMFGDDAVKASKILGITLTKRNLNAQTIVPMCGVPYHSVSRYIKRLVEEGLTIAVADQMEDASSAKGIVRRDVTRIITPGTLIEDEYLNNDRANYLAVVVKRKERYGFAILESSGGIVYTGEVDNDSSQTLIAEIESRSPRELKLSSDLYKSQFKVKLSAVLRDGSITETGAFPSDSDLVYFAERQFKAPLLALGIEGKTAALQALFEIVRTLRYNFKVQDLKLSLVPIDLSDKMVLDAHSLANLELIDSLFIGGESLLSVYIRPRTGMGRRTIVDWLRSPLRIRNFIEARLAALEKIIANKNILDRIKMTLDGICDIERIAHRASLNKTNPKELAALRDSLTLLIELQTSLNEVVNTEQEDNLLLAIANTLSQELPIRSILLETLTEDPPLVVSDGNVIAATVSHELDEYRTLVLDGKAWFLTYQEQEADKTGIRSLKVKFTSTFGYFIEVSKANQHLVPDYYERKQTLVNAERYTTPQLSEYELKLTNAESSLHRIEREIFDNLVEKVAGERDILLSISSAIGSLDTLISLAETAITEKWHRPLLTDESGLEIRKGRHPMVERAVGVSRYVANDVVLDPKSQQIVILTGPNMGGKSTYMRMVALIVLMAHCGSYVPAEYARIGLIDRVFTRIGASDALARGQSTFMVEMIETAEILNSASSRSLIVLDEVGRGTGTYDGLSIAKAVIEYLHENIRANPLTLFATHYFELTELEVLLKRVVNYKMEVIKDNNDFVFLYSVNRGFTDESYGIEVARLAGLPNSVIKRARGVLAELEDIKQAHLRQARRIMQLGLFEE